MTGSETTVPWLTILAALPLVGALAVMLLPRGTGDALPKQVALGVSLVALVIVGRSWPSQFDADGGFQFVESTTGSRRSAPTTPSASTASGSCWCCSRRS